MIKGKAWLAPLERRLGHTFTDPALAELALTHRSNGARNNERLEFLGDALLGLVMAEDLYARFPQASEGQMSRLRARLVKGVTLAEVARELEIGDYLRMGAGELKSGGFNRTSVLADALEALIGAIYLDAGLSVCRQRVRDWYARRLEALSLADNQKDPKTRLQEYLQSRRLELPRYELREACGEAHDQIFHVSCELLGLELTTQGSGKSRRRAEQEAALAALKILESSGKVEK